MKESQNIMKMIVAFLSPAVVLNAALLVKCISNYPRILQTCN